MTTDLPAGWVLDEASAEEVERERAVYEPFTDRLRNAMAPPLHIETDGASRSWADFELGARPHARHAARHTTAGRGLDRPHEGRKSFVGGFVADEDGRTVEAEGIFIQPREWTR
jgi:hypothetical protein